MREGVETGGIPPEAGYLQEPVAGEGHLLHATIVSPRWKPRAGYDGHWSGPLRHAWEGKVGLLALECPGLLGTEAGGAAGMRERHLHVV